MKTARALLALAFLVAGCSSTPRIDWESRVGAYTHDDAIRELGPPEKSAPLSDGSIVADWIEARGMRTATGYPGPWHPYGRRAWSGTGVYVLDPPAPDRFLRLTFNPQGKLDSWRKVVQ